MPSYVTKKARNFCPSQFTILGTHYFKFFLENFVTGVICLDMICDFLISQNKGHIAQWKCFSVWWVANSLWYVFQDRKLYGSTCIKSRKSTLCLLYIKSLSMRIVQKVRYTSAISLHQYIYIRSAYFISSPSTGIYKFLMKVSVMGLCHFNWCLLYGGV
jgi:hypothetical protein